ncbi:hypothetical protein ACOSQ4_018744 [Xanthoceras sorbifolium]
MSSRQDASGASKSGREHLEEVSRSGESSGREDEVTLADARDEPELEGVSRSLFEAPQTVMVGSPSAIDVERPSGSKV